MAGGGLDERREREPAGMSGRLRKQLGVMVRSVGWSYAIYWCSHSDRPRARGGRVVLEWRDGYYNGDIRTRRTTHPPDDDDDLRPDRRGLRRTTQLRELYESLDAAGEGGDERRPSSAASQLSPEDLTHSEWYFLVCMSFTFADGQGLPGRTLSCGKELWLCNAQFADCRIFSRSLLAKSASIQTIVCAPFMGGVLELGTTEHVFEDKGLIKHLTSSSPERPTSVSSGPSQSIPRRDEDEGQAATPSVDIAKAAPYAILHSDENQKISSVTLYRNISSEIDDGNIWSEDNGLPPTASPYAMHSRTSSGFMAWKKSSSMDALQKEKPTTGPHQKLLKKILSSDYSSRDVGNLDVLEHDNNKNNYVGLGGPYGTTMTMKRSELLNEKFLALRSLVPSLNEVDKAYVIEDTIDYVKELEGRLEELEGCEGLLATERVDQKGRRDHVASEKTSDSYGSTLELMVAGEAVARQQCATILSTQKGRCCPAAEITVSVLAGGKEVVVEMCCLWRESLLVEIIDAIGGVHMEIHSMQTSAVDGCLYLTIKSKLQGPAPVSPRTIKQALCRVVTSCC